jgi:hypothetical protein
MQRLGGVVLRWPGLTHETSIYIYDKGDRLEQPVPGLMNTK